MTETATVTLTMDIWASLHAMANGQRGALHVERQVMHAFEKALDEARKAEPPADDPAPVVKGKK